MNPEQTKSAPLRTCWTQILGSDALPLLDELRSAHKANRPGKEFGPFARQLLRKASQIPPARRQSYVTGTIRNLTTPESEETDEPLYDRLKRRIGKNAAARFFDNFYNVPLFRRGASDDQVQARFDTLLRRALSLPYPSRTAKFLRAVVTSAKRDIKQKHRA